MKIVVLASITGAALALAIAGTACQSSSSGDAPPAGPAAGTVGDSSTGGTGAAGSTAGSGAGAMGGSSAGGMAGAGAGAMGGSAAGTSAAGGPGMGGMGAAGVTGMGGMAAAGMTGAGGGSGGMCSKVGTLHPPDPAMPGIYCPFGGPMGMGASHCMIGQEHCCEGAVGEVTMCVKIGAPCPQMKATDWACEDPTDCQPAGMQCCGNGQLKISPDPMCGNFASKMTGTTCKAKCDPMDITMCSSDAECPMGKMCIPFSKAGNQVGGCQQ